MRTIIFITITIVLIIIKVIAIPKAHAQVSTPEGRLETQVSATVGEFYLTVSGFVAPYASIVLTTTNGAFLKSSVADSQGNFSFEKHLVERGFSGFCLTAVDFKQLGESKTCFSFPPLEDSITMTDLFLSPTLGLSRAEIGVGNVAYAFGYTRPGAKVTLYITNNRTLTAVADNTGYYAFELKNLPPGQYDLYALAEENGRKSIKPTKQIQLKVLTYTEQTTNALKNLLDRLVDLITTIWYIPLLFAIPLLILIIILIRKLWPKRFSIVIPRKEERKLHHWWFIGY